MDLLWTWTQRSQGGNELHCCRMSPEHTFHWTASLRVISLSFRSSIDWQGWPPTSPFFARSCFRKSEGVSCKPGIGIFSLPSRSPEATSVLFCFIYSKPILLHLIHGRSVCPSMTLTIRLVRHSFVYLECFRGMYATIILYIYIHKLWNSWFSKKWLEGQHPC